MVEYFLLEKLKIVTRVIMGLNPQNLSKAFTTIVSIVMKALGFHIFVESYNHLKSKR